MKEYKYQKLAKQLKHNIKAMHWPEHTKLPSIRVLAKQHCYSIITVQKSLQWLESQGLLYAKQKSGYYVSPLKETFNGEQKKPLSQPKHVNVPSVLLEIMEQSAAFDLCPQSTHNYHVTKHIQTLNRHICRATRQNAYINAQYYAKPTGLTELKEQICSHYQTRGLKIKTNQLCVTSGCQNSLFISLMVTCNAGDIVAVESPAFYGVLQLLQHLNLKVIELPCSYTHGLSAATLAQAATRWPIKACVVTPSFSTPTGSHIPDEEQQALFEIANNFNITIIEDDIYGDLGFHHKVSPMKSHDSQAQSLLCGSFSKSLSRDLRVGWVIASKNIEKISHFKLISQLATSQAMQQGLATFMQEGHYERHLNHFREKLLLQRQQLVKALEKYWQFPIEYTLPEGGIVLWLKLPKGINGFSLFQEAIKQGIMLTPGQLFTTEKKFQRYIRLSFAHPIIGERLITLKKLGLLIKTNISDASF